MLLPEKQLSGPLTGFSEKFLCKTWVAGNPNEFLAQAPKTFYPSVVYPAVSDLIMRLVLRN